MYINSSEFKHESKDMNSKARHLLQLLPLHNPDDRPNTVINSSPCSELDLFFVAKDGPGREGATGARIEVEVVAFGLEGDANNVVAHFAR